MDTLVKELLTTGGPLGVLVLVVIFFLKHLRAEAELNRQLFKEIHADHMAARIEMRNDARETNAAMKEIAIAVAACALKTTFNPQKVAI